MNIVTQNSDLDCHICPFCKAKLFQRYHYCFHCGKEIKEPRYLLDIIISWEDRASEIDDLLHRFYLSEWDKGFLKSVRERKIFSKKQIIKLNRIFERERGYPLIDDFP